MAFEIVDCRNQYPSVEVSKVLRLANEFKQLSNNRIGYQEILGVALYPEYDGATEFEAHQLKRCKAIARKATKDRQRVTIVIQKYGMSVWASLE